MAGARQNNSQEFITNLSKKIEKMMDTAENYNEDIVKLLSSIDKTQKGSISVELKKQTLTLDKIHTSINKWNEKLTNTIKNSLEKSNQYGVQINFTRTNLVKNNEELVKQTKILNKLLISTKDFHGKFLESQKGSRGVKDTGTLASLEKIHKTKLLPVLVNIYKTVRNFYDLYTSNLEKKIKSGKSEKEVNEKSVKGITNISKEHSKLVELTKSSNKKLDTISDHIKEMNTKNGLILASIDKKIGKQAGMTDYNKSSLPDPKGLESFFNVLIKSGSKALITMMLSLQIIGKFTPDALTGAKTLAGSIKILIKSAEGVSLATAAKSVAAIAILGGSKIENLLLALGKVSAAEFLFGTNSMVTKAENLAEAVKILIRVSEGLDDGTVAKSIAIYGLVEASKLKELMVVLTSSFGERLADMFTGNAMLNRAKDLNEALKVIADTSKDIRMEEVIKSILIYRFIAASKLDELVTVLTKSFGLFGISAFGRMKRRATSLRVAVAILAGATTSTFDLDNEIDSSKFTLNNVAKSVLIYNLIGHGVGILLGSLMKSFGFLGLGGTNKIVKRATNIKKAIGILISAVSEIETEPLVKSIGAILILGIAVTLFVKPLIWAGLLFPLVWIGLKVISGGFGKLLSIVNEIQGNDKKILASAVLMATIAIFIGGLIFNSVIAAVLAPIILLGAGVMYLTVKLYISAINQLKKNNVNQTDLAKATILSTIIGTLAAIMVTLMLTDKKIDFARSAINIGMFIVTMSLLTVFSVKIANYVAKNTPKGAKPLESLSVSLSNMVNAVTMILISKFMDDPKVSLKGILIFGIAMMAISWSTAHMLKNLADSKVTLPQILGLVATVISLVGLTLLVIFAAKAINPSDLIGVGIFMLSAYIIIKGVDYLIKMIPTDHKTMLKGILSIVGFVVGMTVALFVMKIASAFVDIAGTLLVVGSILLITHIAKKIGTEENYKSIMNAAKSILLISASIFALSIAISFFSSRVFLADVALVALSVIGIGYSFHFIGKKEQTIKDGAIAIAYTAGAIALLSMAFMMYTSSGITISDTITLGLTLLVIGGSFYLLGKMDKDIKQGALALALSALAILVLTPAMMFWKTAQITISDSIALGISLISIAGAMAIAGSFWKQVAKGALVLGLSAIAIFALTPSLAFYKGINFGIMDAISLSLTLVGVGGAMAIVGSFWVPALKGSLAMVAASIAIGILTIGLFMFKASQFGLMDALTLSLTIVMVGGAIALIGLMWVPVLKGALAMLGVAIAVGILSIALFVFKATKFDLMDTLTLGLTVLGLGIVFYLVGTQYLIVLKGALAIAGLGAAIWVLSHGMKVWSKINVKLKDIATLAGTIAMFGIEFGIAGNFYKDILKGAAAIAGLGAAIWVLSHGMKVWTSAKAKLSDVAVLGATIGMLAVEFALVGAYEEGLMTGIPLTITTGSLVIAGLGAALWVLSHGMKIWTSAEAKMSDVKVLGATIAMLGIEFAAIGFGSILIIAGSVAMAATALPLRSLTKSLKIFSEAKFEKTDGDNLSYALQSVVDGFLGGKMPGGFIEGLSFAAKSAARVALMKPAIPVMIGASRALLPISKALKEFKNAGITSEDGDTVRSVLVSVMKTFSIAGSIEQQKKHGIKFNHKTVGATINLLSSVGNILASLGEGVRAWASLEINEYVVVNPGTAKAKLALKSRRKLSQTDFDNAAYGMAKVISAVAEPLAKIGRLQKGKSSGDPYLDKVFAGNYVSEGVKSLTGIGAIMASLSLGVNEFARMEFTEYEVVNAGTDKAKLVPKIKRKLTDPEIKGAGTNIGKILSVVGYQFAKIGRKEEATEGKQWPWSGGWVSKGIDALDGIQEILGAVTKGVVSMVYNEIPTFELINGGTDKAKLVPGKSIKVTDTDLEKAAKKIGYILRIVAYEFAKIGRSEDNTEGPFSGGWVTKGVKSLSGISGILKAVVENLSNIAYGSFQPMELVNAGTPNAKLVPGTPIKLSTTDLVNAGKNIGKILKVLGQGIVHFGIYSRDHKGYFDSAIESISKINIPLKAASLFLGDWNKIKDPINSAYNIKKFFKTITEIFDPENNKNRLLSDVDGVISSYTKNVVNLGRSAKSINEFTHSIYRFEKLKNPKGAANDISSFISTINANFDVTKNRNLKTTMDNMGMFTTGITNIAKKADPLEKAAKNMDKIQKSMKLMKDSVNSMDLRKLTLTDAMLRSMAILSKNPEAMAKTIEKSLNASFKELIAAIKSNLPAKAATNYTPVKTEVKTVTTDNGTVDDVKKEAKKTGYLAEDAKKSGFKNDSNVFGLSDANTGMYQAMVEALNDVVIRTVSVSSGNDYRR